MATRAVEVLLVPAEVLSSDARLEGRGRVELTVVWSDLYMCISTLL